MKNEPVNQRQLDAYLRSHQRYLANDTHGHYLDFYERCGSNPILRDLEFWRMNLHGVSFKNADLQGTSFVRCNLAGTDFEGANLKNVGFDDCNLSKSQFEGSIIDDTTNFGNHQILPPVGCFHVWKKVRDGAILELLVSKNAKRVCTPFGRKCRVSKVKVLGVWSDKNLPLDTTPRTFYSKHDPSFAYTVGKWVEVADIDLDIRIECTKGIHVFITPEEVEKY